MTHENKNEFRSGSIENGRNSPGIYIGFLKHIGNAGPRCKTSRLPRLEISPQPYPRFIAKQSWRCMAAPTYHGVPRG
jgi:hypothetical protein